MAHRTGLTWAAAGATLAYTQLGDVDVAEAGAASMAAKAAVTARRVKWAAALQKRAQTLQGARADDWLRQNGTTTVMRMRNAKTNAYQTWIATEDVVQPVGWAKRLRRKMGDRFIAGLGHAEQTIITEVDRLKKLGQHWEVVAGGTSRNVCVNVCEPLLGAHGLELGGPVFRRGFATGPKAKTLYRMFWRPG